MSRINFLPSLPAWDISALLYARTYDSTSHGVDSDVFDWLGDDLVDADVVDCGCGPGVVVEKLLQRGVASVYAIDISAGMLEQVPDDERVHPIEARIVPGILSDLREKNAPAGFDLVLFKRSLYAAPDEARAILSDAFAATKPGGAVVIIHPETSLLHYVLDEGKRLAPHSLYHGFNRVLSRVTAALGLHEYHTYTGEELRELGWSVVGSDGEVLEISSQQTAFNLVVLRKDSAV